ncbi:MAG: MFS transporter, partial [Candidatus Bathyarchaeia archaeon]
IREKRLKTLEEKAKRMGDPFIRGATGLLALFFFYHLFETTGLGMVDLVLPLLMEDRFHLSYHLIGLFFTGANLVTLITQMPSGYLADRYGRKKLIIVCVSGIPVALGLWLFMDNWVSMLILYVTAQGLWSVTWPATLALLTDSVKPEVIGTAFGIRMTGVRLGFTVGPAVSGVMYSVLGHPAIFLTAALLYLAAIPLATLFKEARDKAAKYASNIKT